LPFGRPGRHGEFGRRRQFFDIFPDSGWPAFLARQPAGFQLFNNVAHQGLTFLIPATNPIFKFREVSIWDRPNQGGVFFETFWGFFRLVWGYTVGRSLSLYHF
jgi:hypothetical protein